MNIYDILEEQYKESNILEFKSGENALPKDFWATYSAFGNTSGGVVILGIFQKNESDELNVVVVKNPEKVITELLNSLNDPNKVSYNLVLDEDIKQYKITDEKGEEKSIITIKIQESQPNKKPIYLNRDLRNSYKRLGDGDRRLTEEDLRYFLTNSKKDIDTELLDGYDLDDINEETVEKYRGILINLSEENAKYEKYNLKDFLIHVGVFRKDRKAKKYKLTTGGLLFFGKYNSICDRFPMFQLDYFEKKSSSTQSRWEDRVSTGDMLYPDMNMFDFYLEVLNKLYATTKDKFHLSETTGRRLPLKSELSKTLREALVNMLMHAYYDANFPTKVTAYEDYYEFLNPGDMKISVEEYIHGGNSLPRNSVIPSLFRRIGAAEKAGTGGELIFDFAHDYNLKLPEIEKKYDRTLIRIWKVDLEHNIKDLPKTEWKIMKYIIDNGKMSRKDILILGLTEYSYRKAIKYLKEKKYIETIGSGPATEHVLHRTSSENYYMNKKMLQELEESITKNGE